MAIEAERGCGFRKVGKLYLVGGGLEIICDRLPLELKTCPTCGHGIHFTKGIGRVNPKQLWGDHITDENNPFGNIGWKYSCQCYTSCFVCKPPDSINYIMFVGEKFYPRPVDFIKEARELGVSKAISSVPKDLKLGESIVYLAHKKAVTHTKYDNVPLDDGQTKLADVNISTTYAPGIFYAFIPRRVEMPVWDDTPEEELEKLKKRGITPVPVPKGDQDHAR